MDVGSAVDGDERTRLNTTTSRVTSTGRRGICTHLKTLPRPAHRRRGWHDVEDQ